MDLPDGMTVMNKSEMKRNPGIPLEMGWVRDTRVNLSATQNRARTLITRRSIKKEWQAAWLLRAITMIDLTTLAGDDTPSKVTRLCAKARQPLRQDIIEALDVESLQPKVAAVCVYHQRVRDARKALKGSGIPVAAVSAGFPAGLSPFEQRIAEIHQSVEAGAQEIDIVISRERVLCGDWGALYDEVRHMRRACGEAHMKAILATGELGPLWQVAKASKVCMMAGADFIKTSTGKEALNATLEVGLTMVREIRDYQAMTGFKVGFKPAGGIRSAKDALNWLILIREELGDDWLHNRLFRFGASGLLTDIERQLSHHITGRYAARHHMPLA
ncbi:MAG: deoxyribose-phosphate aldolase [Chloroflexi bacterium]|nr:deoxyribose-phosphate aldolase [Chloroflexota bacterium]